MDNNEIRSYLKSFKKYIKDSSSSTEGLLNIKKDIDNIESNSKLSGATKKFLLDFKKKLNTSINKSKRKVVSKLNYFENKSIEASPAEKLIIRVLNTLKVKYLREVSFNGFITDKGYHYRYDFYIPSKNLIIEYDGKLYHDNKVNDIIKNRYCLDNNIKLIRLNAKHYYHLDTELKKILK